MTDAQAVPEYRVLHAAQTAGYTSETLVNRRLDVAAVRYFGQSDPASLDTQAAEERAA